MAGVNGSSNSIAWRRLRPSVQVFRGGLSLQMLMLSGARSLCPSRGNSATYFIIRFGRCGKEEMAVRLSD